jgi:NMD protein affecting ribosome stability and mRNA decay
MKALPFVLCCVACLAGERRFGQPLTLREAIPVSKILEAPDRHVGKTVQVRGRVTEVCQAMGCWMSLVDPSTGQSLRIKVNDGEIEFPKDASGRTAIAEGTLRKFVLTKEQAAARARHEAEEQGRKFDPSSVQAGSTVYQIQGAGAVLID